MLNGVREFDTEVFKLDSGKYSVQDSWRFIEADEAAVFGVAVHATLLFVAAFALNVTPHEAVHALAGCLLGFNSTLFSNVGES